MLGIQNDQDNLSTYHSAFPALLTSRIVPTASTIPSTGPAFFEWSEQVYNPATRSYETPNPAGRGSQKIPAASPGAPTEYLTVAYEVNGNNASPGATVWMRFRSATPEGDEVYEFVSAPSQPWSQSATGLVPGYPLADYAINANSGTSPVPYMTMLIPEAGTWLFRITFVFTMSLTVAGRVQISIFLTDTTNGNQRVPATNGSLGGVASNYSVSGLVYDAHPPLSAFSETLTVPWLADMNGPVFPARVQLSVGVTNDTSNQPVNVLYPNSNRGASTIIHAVKMAPVTWANADGCGSGGGAGGTGGQYTLFTGTLDDGTAVSGGVVTGGPTVAVITGTYP